MKRLFIARHGETDYNRAERWQGASDIPLNKEGRMQAARLAERIKGLGIAAVGGSTLSRAAETASIVAGHLGVPLLVGDRRLRERSFGVFEGLTYAQCEADFPEVFARYRTDPAEVPPGAEEHESLVARMRAGVLEAASATPDALLITHGGAMRALVNSVYQELRVPRIGNCEIYEVHATAHAIVSARWVDR
jgi:broad specificity phosphatase PhoE